MKVERMIEIAKAIEKAHPVLSLEASLARAVQSFFDPQAFTGNFNSQDATPKPPSRFRKRGPGLFPGKDPDQYE